MIIEPIQCLPSSRTLRERIEIFARAAVAVEQETGFPALVLAAAWGVESEWGRNEVTIRKRAGSWHDCLMSFATDLRASAGEPLTVLDMCATLDRLIPGFANACESWSLKEALQKARRA
mgnify:CR=1 FL=1